MRAILTLIAVLSLALVATAADHAPYAWSTELPSELAAHASPSRRTAAEVDSFFGPPLIRHSLDEVVTTFGQPDGFTRQAIYSVIEGTAQPQPYGGTVRFILEMGGQLLIRTGDFHQIYEAIRYDKHGRATLLWK